MIFDYEIIVSIYLFSRLKILNLKIDKEKMKKLNLKEKIKPEQIEKLKQQAPNKKELIETLKQLNIKCTEFKLNAEIDTPSVILTTGLVTLISTIISIFLSGTINKSNINECQYKITPLYTSRNMLKIDFKSRINVKMINIIYIIYMLIKKKKIVKSSKICYN